MATGTKTKFVVNSISWIAPRESFLINQGNKDAQWLSGGFIKQIFSNLGLSTKTSFQLLKGCTIQCYGLNITDEMIAAGNGSHKAPSNLGDGTRMIEWKKPGMKYFDHTVLANSAMLDQAIIGTGVHLDDSWAGNSTPVAKPVATVQTPEPPAPEPPAENPTIDGDGDHVDLDDATGVDAEAENPAQNA